MNQYITQFVSLLQNTSAATAAPAPSPISKISTYSAAMDIKLLPGINHEPWTSKKVKGKW